MITFLLSKKSTFHSSDAQKRTSKIGFPLVRSLYWSIKPIWSLGVLALLFATTTRLFGADEGSITFSNIDDGLNSYYRSQGKDNYYDNDDKGKFSVYCEEEEFDFEAIEEELDGDAADCGFLDFDENFPFPQNIAIDDEKKGIFIFSLIKQIDSLKLHAANLYQFDSSMLLEKIDYRLNIHYLAEGKSDYFSGIKSQNERPMPSSYQAQIIGKFSAYCKEKGYDEETIKEELQGVLEDCGFLDFDDDFPLPKSVLYKNQKTFIFGFLKEYLFPIAKECDRCTIGHKDLEPLMKTMETGCCSKKGLFNWDGIILSVRITEFKKINLVTGFLRFKKKCIRISRIDEELALLAADYKYEEKDKVKDKDKVEYKIEVSDHKLSEIVILLILEYWWCAEDFGKKDPENILEHPIILLNPEERSITLNTKNIEGLRNRATENRLYAFFISFPRNNFLQNCACIFADTREAKVEEKTKDEECEESPDPNSLDAENKETKAYQIRMVENIKSIAYNAIKYGDKSFLCKPIFMLWSSRHDSKKYTRGKYTLKTFDIETIFHIYLMNSSDILFPYNFIKKDRFLAKYLQIQWLFDAERSLMCLRKGFRYFKGSIEDIESSHTAFKIRKIVDLLINDRLDATVLREKFKTIMRRKYPELKLSKHNEHNLHLQCDIKKYNFIQRCLEEAIKDKGLDW